MSPLAFSAGTAEARITITVGVTFSCLTTTVGASSGVGDVSVIFEFRELGREARFGFLVVSVGVGRGSKAFEIDCPTLLKKSLTASAFAHRPLKKNSAATGTNNQRERMTRIVMLSAFNVKLGFSARSRG